MKCLRQILYLLLCVTGVANAIPLPCELIWNIRFSDDDPIVGPSWIEGQNFCFAVGSNDSVHVISNGRVIRSSQSLGGAVTAIARADAWEDVEGNEFVVGILNDSLTSILVLDNEQLMPVRDWAIGTNWRDRPIPDSLHMDGFTTHSTDIRTINLIGEAADNEYAITYRSADSYYSPRGGGANSRRNGYICTFSMTEGRILDSSKCGSPPRIWFEEGQPECETKIATAGEKTYENNDDIGYWGKDSCYLSLYDSSLSKLAVDTVAIATSIHGWGGAYIIDLEGVLTNMNGRVLFLSYANDFDFGTFKYQNYVAAYSIDDLELISRIEFDTTTVYSVVAVANSPNNENQDYLLCWTDYGIRVFNLNTWQMEDVVYNSSIGVNDVQIKDFDGDEQLEILGRSTNRLSFARFQPLRIASDLSETPTVHLSLSSYPNPFNSSTTISYTLPKPGWTTMDIVDVSGRLVMKLSDGWKEAGSYREEWNGSGEASGRYIVRLNSHTGSYSRSVTIIK